MAVIQLVGGSVKAPEGALILSLSREDGLLIELVDSEMNVVEPNFKMKPSQVVLVPSGAVTVMARTVDGRSMPSNTRLGLSIKSASGSGDEINRPAIDVSGRQSVALVQIVDGQIKDLVDQASRNEKGWMRQGNYAYHLCHKQGSSHSRAWGIVLDGSTILEVRRNRAAYEEFLELVFGIAATAYGCLPSICVIATDPLIDCSSAFQSDQIDFDAMFSHHPAPWPSLSVGVEEVLRKLPADGALLLVVDGPFVDYREVREKIGSRPCVLVVQGRSRFGARAQDRAQQFWAEEFSCFDDYPRVCAVSSLDGLQEGCGDIAAAMFPGRER